MMPNMEKVIKGLKHCLALDSPCGDCPYYSHEDIQELDCERNLRNDAISMMKKYDELLHKKQHDVDRLCNEISEWKHKFHDKLLKEQEKATVISIHRNGFGSRVGACPNCQSVLHYEYNQSFCGKCGQAVKWE